jgi:hypothetical protein
LKDVGLLIRIGIFTLISILLVIAGKLGPKVIPKYAGYSIAIASGVLFMLSNFWVYALIATVSQVFTGQGQTLDIYIFITASIVLTLSNFYGVIYINESFKYGQASNIIPIQQIPIQIGPIFYYFSIFLLTAPTLLSILLLLPGIGFIILSGFLLGKRQAALEEIK